MGYYEEVLGRKFPSYKIVDYTRKTFWERTQIMLSKLVSSSYYAKFIADIKK